MPTGSLPLQPAPSLAIRGRLDGSPDRQQPASGLGCLLGDPVDAGGVASGRAGRAGCAAQSPARRVAPSAFGNAAASRRLCSDGRGRTPARGADRAAAQCIGTGRPDHLCAVGPGVERTITHARQTVGVGGHHSGCGGAADGQTHAAARRQRASQLHARRRCHPDRGHDPLFVGRQKSLHRGVHRHTDGRVGLQQISHGALPLSLPALDLCLQRPFLSAGATAGLLRPACGLSPAVGCAAVGGLPTDNNAGGTAGFGCCVCAQPDPGARSHLWPERSVCIGLDRLCSGRLAPGEAETAGRGSRRALAVAFVALLWPGLRLQADCLVVCAFLWLAAGSRQHRLAPLGVASTVGDPADAAAAGGPGVRGLSPAAGALLALGCSRAVRRCLAVEQRPGANRLPDLGVGSQQFCAGAGAGAGSL